MSTENLSFTDFEFEGDRMAEVAKGQLHKLDAALHVQFYKHAELNTFKSGPIEKGGEGRKVFDEHVYIRILMPANRLNIVERRATEEDRARFRAQFLKFVQTGENLVSGTPLNQLPGISPSQVLELNALKVTTVEQLAMMPDSTMQLLGTGGQTQKQAAIKYLDRTANAVELSAKNRELSAELQELRAQLDQLMAGKEKAEAAAELPTVRVGQPDAPVDPKKA